jgi:ribonuclease D
MLSSKQKKNILWKEARSKFGRATIRPQDQFPLFLDQRRQLNNKINWPKYNPFETAISLWTPDPTFTNNFHIQPKGRALFVDSKEKWTTMMDDISSKLEIAVDLEGHHEHSFLGMTMYIQISSSERDYLIHVPSCIDQVIAEFKSLIESPQIIKIFHGGQNDVLSLQRDFGFFVRGYIDTQAVYNYVYGVPDEGQFIGFKSMATELLGKERLNNLVECAQVADWRLLPLPNAMFQYAQSDSSLLLECWQILKRQLVDEQWKNSQINPITVSNNIAIKSYKENKQTQPSEDLQRYPVSNEQHELFIDLHQWRLQRAMYVDEPPSEIITTQELQKLVNSSPTTIESLKSIFHPKSTPKWIRGLEEELFSIIRKYTVDSQQTKIQPTTNTDDDWDVLQIHAPNIPVYETPISFTITQNEIVPTQIPMEIELPATINQQESEWKRSINATKSAPTIYKTYSKQNPKPSHILLLYR